MRFKTLLLILYTLPALASESHFEKGNQAYDLKQYENAVTEYRQLLDANRTSAAVHFNLANAYHQISRERDDEQVRGATQLGWAIYHYRTARLLAPRDVDIRTNLELARDRVHGHRQAPREWDQEETKHKGATKYVLTFFTINEWTVAGSVMLTSCLMLLTAGCVVPAWRSRFQIWTPVLGVTGLLLSLIAMVAFGYWQAQPVRARGYKELNPRDINWKSKTAEIEAVNVGDTEVSKRPLPMHMVPPGVEHKDPDPLRDGIELRIVEHRDDGDWLKVTFADGVLKRSGWLQMNAETPPNLLVFPR